MPAVKNNQMRLGSTRETLAPIKSGREIIQGTQPLLKPRNSISPFRARAVINKENMSTQPPRETQMRTKSPLRRREQSQIKTQSRSPLSRTPARQNNNDNEKLIAELFCNLTRNQPKTIKILSP